MRLAPASLVCLLTVACTSGASDTGTITPGKGLIVGDIVQSDGEAYTVSTVITIAPEGGDAFDLLSPEGTHYEAEVDPGDYTISAVSDSNGCFMDPDVHVTVEEGQRTRADLLIEVCIGR